MSETPRTVPELQLDRTLLLFLQRSREVAEVAAGRVGYWLQITGCVHRNLRAKQSVLSSSISTLRREATLLHSCFVTSREQFDFPVRILK